MSVNRYIDMVSKNGWWTYPKLTKELMKYGIVTKDGKPNWALFFGIKEKKKWTLESLQEAVRKNGIKSYAQYQIESSKNGWWSYAKVARELRERGIVTEDGKSNWALFLGIEEKKVWTLESLQKAVQAKGITSTTKYKNVAPEKELFS